MDSSSAVQDSVVLPSSSLLESYNASTDTYFSAPDYRLLAKPPFAQLLPGVDRTDLFHRVSESLRFATELGHEEAIVIGAVPFNASKPAYLRLSTNAEVNQKLSVLDKRLAPIMFPVSEVACSVTPLPNAEVFKNSISEALSLIDSTELSKVVLSRRLQLQSSTPFEEKNIVQRLENANQSGYTFSIDLVGELEYEAERSTLIGASPELLVSLRDGKLIANPLAGSEPRTGDEQRDAALCEGLLRSEKDLREHRVVVDDVIKILKPLCSNLDIPEGPSILRTPTMLHLSTEIVGELKNPATTSVEIALALHPTPAVCGEPRERAQETIERLENYDRGAFCGMVGWCDAKGNGDWVVTIRCATLKGSTATLYAGAGVVAGSCPDKEWKETGAKFKTMLNAIGI